MVKSGKVLHICGWDKKFIPQFIKFIKNNFNHDDHKYIIYGKVDQNEAPDTEDIILMPRLHQKFFLLVAEMHAARKIIIHGLFSSHLIYILSLQPWLLRKCYWVIWGGDLYVHNACIKDWRWRKNEIFRKFVIKRLKHFVTHVKGDYDFACQWYKASGEWHECFMYPSNLYQEVQSKPLPKCEINILLGNSADPSNNHIEVLEKLKSYAGENIRIYCPLSYGSKEYADKVTYYGSFHFGEKFTALREFMPYDEYLKLLVKIDIAIFNHKRQQGMGNITTLLGMGKKVYIRKNISTWMFFQDLGVTVYGNKFYNLSLIKKKYLKKILI